jgi:UDP-glucose 4-epimerase
LLKQATDEKREKFTLTHAAMTRFMMTLHEAAQLIDTALLHAKNGDLWVPKLPSMKILNLIQFFSKKFNKPYEITGIREGEKIHEVMLSNEEAMRVDIRDQYFVYNKSNEIKNNLTKEYSSADHLLSYAELEKFMNNYLDSQGEHL